MLYVCLTAQVSPSTAVNDWDDEKFYYNYGANTCSFVCGHYTQVGRFDNNYNNKNNNKLIIMYNLTLVRRFAKKLCVNKECFLRQSKANVKHQST